MKEEKPVPDTTLAATGHSLAGDCWLEVTNFAINIRLLENARNAADGEELKERLSNDLFFGLATLLDDSRPEPKRPSFVREETYRREYGQRILAMISGVSTALQIVRDIFWFYEVRYEPKAQKFLAPLGADAALTPAQLRPTFVILESVFDYPDFEPFRFAYCIISDVTAPYSTVSRTADEGEFAYSLTFKMIKEGEVTDNKRTLNLRKYVPHTQERRD